MKNIKYKFKISLLFISLLVNNNMFAQGNSCIDNNFKNGDFETGTPCYGNSSCIHLVSQGHHQNIGDADGWVKIWNSNSSFADFYSSGYNAGGFPKPCPPTGNYGGCWISNLNEASATYREGMFGTLINPIVSNTGSYTFSFDMAKIGGHGISEIGVYGIYNPSNLPTNQPISSSHVTSNMDLFGVSNTVLLGTISVPADTSCNKQNYSITFSSSGTGFPVNGVTHILVTRSDNVMSGRSYCAFDNFCMQISEPEEPELCCDISGLNVYLLEKNGKYELNISGTTAIQEIEVSMMDYHLEYSEADCKPADIGMFGIISSTTPNLSTLVLDPASNNSQSLSWLPGSPSVLNSDVINLEVTKPAVLNIKCCDVKFTFCLKVTFKDINCNVCEIIVCPIKDWNVLNQQKILSGDDDPVNVALNEGRKKLNKERFGKDVEEWYAQLNKKPWITEMLKKYPDDIKSLLKVGRRLIQENGKLERHDLEIIEKSMRLLDSEVVKAPEGFIEEALNRLRSSVGKNWQQLMDELKK